MIFFRGGRHNFWRKYTLLKVHAKSDFVIVFKSNISNVLCKNFST